MLLLCYSAVCAPGYGQSTDAGGVQCTKCGYNSYQNSQATAACTTCPSRVFLSTTSFGAAEPVTSEGFTLRTGSTFESACVLRASQLMLEDAAMSPALTVAPGWFTRDATTASARVSACNSATLCFAEFTHTAADHGTRKTLMLEPIPTGAAGGLQLHVKLAPGADVSALTKKKTNQTAAKAVSSGMYAVADIQAWTLLVARMDSNQFGAEMEGSAAGWQAKDVAGCQDMCDR
jgi:hypothetical protein